MNKYLKSKWGIIFLIVIVFIAGIIIGITTKHFFDFTLNKNVGISDLANLLLALLAAFWIPIFLSPIISNRRSLKDFLIGEVKDCIQSLAVIKIEVDQNVSTNASSTVSKQKTNSLISRDLSMKLNSLKEQLKDSFGDESNALISDISGRYQEYWQDTTGGALMSNNFRFDNTFQILHDRSYAKLEHCLKKAVHQINDF